MDNECYNSPPLESDFVLKFLRFKQLFVMLPRLFLRLLSPLGALSMFPLNLDQSNHLIAQGLFLPI